MKRFKALDLRTEKGQRIYEDIANFYPSVRYSIRHSKDIFYAEGYSHVVLANGEIIIIAKEGFRNV